MRKTQPLPTLMMSKPATAGPSMRAALNEVELSATAFARSSSPTISETNVWRTGASKAVTQPSRKANTYTCHSCTWPLIHNIPRPSASKPMAACVHSNNFLRSSKSAAMPVRGSNNNCGPNCKAMTMPTALALCYVNSLSTSQSCAVRCIQVPIFDTKAPPAQIR